MDTCHTATMGNPATSFYIAALAQMKAAEIPFLVGGAFAYSRYSGLHRDTKDLDVFVRPNDVPRTLALFERAGYQTALPFPHWLAKIHCAGQFIDLIFSSGNGLARVDDQWFEHSDPHEVLGLEVCLCPPEEMIWSKAFIQERERFDGADIHHLLRECGPRLDWPRLLMRFDDHWPVLFSHVVLFRYVYPNRRQAVPDWVVDELMQRFAELSEKPNVAVCRGTLLSREQYLHDIEHVGYEDARLPPYGNMTPAEMVVWTAAIGDDKKK